MKTPTIKYDDVKHKYWIDGEEVPSVTQILDAVTPKDALPWWGMRVGIAALIKMMQTEKVSWPVVESHIYEEVLSGIPEKGPKKVNRRGKEKVLIEQLVIESKLDTNAIKRARGDEGTEIHDAIQKVGIDDVLPVLDDFSAEFRPYLRAFSRFWLDHDPVFLEQETIVGHRGLRYAGRTDLKALIRGLKTMIDFKTSKDVYETHHEQLRLYDVGDRYMGQFEASFEPCDNLAVVRLGRDGQYEMVYSDFVSAGTAFAAIELASNRKLDAERGRKGRRAKIDNDTILNAKLELAAV